MAYLDNSGVSYLWGKIKGAFETKDATIVKDASYVHTDNNYTTAEKTKLSGIETGAEANVVKGVDDTTISIDASGIISLALPNLDGAGY